MTTQHIHVQGRFMSSCKYSLYIQSKLKFPSRVVLNERKTYAVGLRVPNESRSQITSEHTHTVGSICLDVFTHERAKTERFSRTQSCCLRCHSCDCRLCLNWYTIVFRIVVRSIWARSNSSMAIIAYCLMVFSLIIFACLRGTHTRTRRISTLTLLSVVFMAVDTCGLKVIKIVGLFSVAHEKGRFILLS